ncbi:hypothetical protein AX15_001572 [Amanita polypyramis BW_CC]|nr:hypothetical protein AX15_001572 [Amanita polypyramis BW_CC]
MTTEPSRILLIDSYDSFSLNLAALCRKSIPGCIIHIIKNDEYTFDELETYLDYFSAVVISAGPGSPAIGKDIGIIKYLWKIEHAKVIPVFGVCLGLQSLGITYGAKLRRLHTVKHGQISVIRHKSKDIFKGVGLVKAVRYHSLYIEVVSGGEIEELAWADDEDNGRVLMACKHKSRPFWAVQYHPESVLTNDAGAQVVQNFWHLSQQWSAVNSRKTRPSDAKLRHFGNLWPSSTQTLEQPPISQPKRQVKTIPIHAPYLTPIDICELLGVHKDDEPFVLLDSAAPPGRFSIIASPLSTSLQITYSLGSDVAVLKEGLSRLRKEYLGAHDIWSWLAVFMQGQRAQGGDPNIPFWGGLIGYLTYELGVSSLQVPVQRNTKMERERHPDINLIFVERSVVFDSSNGYVYVQSLLEDDDAWFSEIIKKLEPAGDGGASLTLPNSILAANRLAVTLPDRERYISHIHRAKEWLYSGDSYELCLTAHTYVTARSLATDRSHSSSWERYKLLRRLNPAPHSAYLRLHPSTLISSSPERFLSFSRAPSPVCQLRPIKGTVKNGPGITRTIAEQALVGSNKEVAENLMIVDLIRHDLHSVVGDDVQVKQFCSVEEYKTVWQLVSVIEGKDSSRPEYEGIGWDVLRRSLPPGSMTGAPKKRSVEILQTLEDAERSLYSGVFGYWCVSGAGDWSVTIRSCFKHDGQRQDATGVSDEEQWTIGAGGAITALSEPEAEWDEMVTKLQSVLRAFGADKESISHCAL